jgi:hypothetical protein
MLFQACETEEKFEGEQHDNKKYHSEQKFFHWRDYDILRVAVLHVVGIMC